MAAAGLAFSLIGTAVGTVGALQQANAMNKVEAARKQQMNLEAMRRRRETLRQSAVARGSALSNATNQGAQDSSALAGGLAQITNQAGRNIVALNQDQILGNKIFNGNRDATNAQGLQSIGSGISSFGSIFSNNADTLSRMFA